MATVPLAVYAIRGHNSKGGMGYDGIVMDAPDRRRRRDRRILGGAVLAYFLGFATLLAFIVPPFQSPDEQDHLEYVNFVATRHELPNQFDPERAVHLQGIQPPLYYLLAAGLVSLCERDRSVDATSAALARDHAQLDVAPAGTVFVSPGDARAFYLLRLLGVALGAATVWMVLRLGRRLLPDAPAALLPALFLATLPQFAFLAGKVSNDILASLFCTMAIYYAYRILEAPERLASFVLLGVSAGLALLSKKTALFLVPGGTVAVVLAAVRNPAQARRILGRGLLALAVALLVCGWYLVRNYRLYGDALGLGMERIYLAREVVPKDLFSPYFRGPFPSDLYRSFIGYFGWLNLPLPVAVYRFYGVLFVAALAGVALRLVEQRGRDAPVWLALLFLGSCLAGIVYFNMTLTQPQGRYLFPAVSAMGLLVAWGLGTLADRLLQTRLLRGFGILTLFLGLLGSDLVSIASLRQVYTTQAARTARPGPAAVQRDDAGG